MTSLHPQTPSTFVFLFNGIDPQCVKEEFQAFVDESPFPPGFQVAAIWLDYSTAVLWHTQNGLIVGFEDGKDEKDEKDEKY